MIIFAITIIAAVIMVPAIVLVWINSVKQKDQENTINLDVTNRNAYFAEINAYIIGNKLTSNSETCIWIYKQNELRDDSLTVRFQLGMYNYSHLKVNIQDICDLEEDNSGITRLKFKIIFSNTNGIMRMNMIDHIIKNEGNCLILVHNLCNRTDANCGSINIYKVVNGKLITLDCLTTARPAYGFDKLNNVYYALVNDGTNINIWDNGNIYTSRYGIVGYDGDIPIPPMKEILEQVLGLSETKSKYWKRKYNNW